MLIVTGSVIAALVIVIIIIIATLINGPVIPSLAAAGSITVLVVRVVITLICLITQISPFACICTFVPEICLEKFFNGPTMWEFLEIAMTLTCLEYKILRKEDNKWEEHIPLQ
jgi:hypothetical protein